MEKIRKAIEEKIKHSFLDTEYDIGYRDALTDALDIIEKVYPQKEQAKQTNADMIRRMKDEQLIPVVVSYVCQKHTTGCPYEHCDDCVRAWLRKEAGHD